MLRPPPAALSCCIVLGLSQAAAALDCGKAKTPVERAICADPAAGRADAAMGAAYAALAGRLDAAARAGLVASQRRWIALRTNLCGDESVKTIGACVAKETGKRTAFLTGQSDSGPGVGVPLTPVFMQAPDRKGFYALDVDVLKFGQPSTTGEKLFNAQVDAILKDVPSSQKRDESDMVLSYDVSMRVAYAAPDLISAPYTVYDFSGGAHGNTLSRTINVDLAAGKVMSYDALFTAAALPKLREACLSQVKAAKKERMPDEAFDAKAATATIDATLRSFDRWTLSPGKAEVGFDAYDLGAYVEGEYTCDFDAALLTPLLKPGVHLP